MKILFVSHDAKLYGAPRSLLNLIQGLINYHPDIKVHVLLPFEGLIENEFKKLGVSYTMISYPWNVYQSEKGFSTLHAAKEFLRGVRSLSNLPAIIKVIKKIDPDIIYTNTSVIITGFLAAKILRKKHVWHIREFGWEDSHFLYSFGNRLQLFFYNNSNLIIVVSNAIKQQKLAGIKTPVKQIYNGVYAKKELIWTARNIEYKDTITFGMVAGIYKAKGQDEAIKAFSDVNKHYPHTKLLLAGSGDNNYIKYLHQLCADFKIQERVEFKGFLKDTSTCYEQIDILLSCSKSEGMGRSIVEAMAHGIPVIGKNSGGVPEIINKDVNGFLYDDIEQLIQLMLAIINQPDKYYKLSVNAIEYVRQNFTIEDYTENVYRAIKKTVH